MRRDPQTGKFVSSGGGGSSVPWSKQKRLAGSIHITIPAADLAGGTEEVDTIGDATEIIDFTDQLENDEIYRLHSMDVTSVLALPTSATAEGNAWWNFVVGPESDTPVMQSSPSFYIGSPVVEDGIADITGVTREAGGVMYNGMLYAEAGLLDTVNGAGAGAAPANMEETVHFGPDGPVFDRDDELYAPSEINVDDVSDHAVVASVGVLLHGHVEELD